MSNINGKLVEVVKSLDISATDFKRAQIRYRAIRNWLLDGQYQSGSIPKGYLQGLFRLGTVIRPYYGDKDGDFDIDQVFEITTPIQNVSAANLKAEVGNRLCQSSIPSS